MHIPQPLYSGMMVARFTWAACLSFPVKVKPSGLGAGRIQLLISNGNSIRVPLVGMLKFT